MCATLFLEDREDSGIIYSLESRTFARCTMQHGKIVVLTNVSSKRALRAYYEIARLTIATRTERFALAVRAGPACTRAGPVSIRVTETRNSRTRGTKTHFSHNNAQTSPVQPAFAPPCAAISPFNRVSARTVRARAAINYAHMLNCISLTASVIINRRNDMRD